jgi:hypothetical protein
MHQRDHRKGNTQKDEDGPMPELHLPRCDLKEQTKDLRSALRDRPPPTSQSGH